MKRNGTLNTAKKKRNDEFYTRLQDVEDELKHYDSFFKNKIVLCNCNDFNHSAFW